MSEVRPIQKNERNLGGFDFFLLWAGAAVSLAEIWAGGILATMGYMTGVAVILLGHIIGNTPLALGGIMGSRWGIPTMVGTRIAFGNNGSYLPALLNILQLIGWTAVMIWIGGQTAAMFTKGSSLYTSVFWIILLGIVTTLWAIIGNRFWKWLHRIAVTALIILCAVMTYIVFAKYGLSSLLSMKASNDLPFMVGLDYVIIMPISWLPLVCDYSRYAKGNRSSFWGTWIGYFMLSSWMYLIGLSTALATNSSTPETMVLELMISFGLVFPALIIVLFSTFTTTFLDIYSASISALNIHAGIGEKKGIIIAGGLGTLIALFFSPDAYTHFLEIIGFIFCPLFGIVLADYFLLRRQVVLTDNLFIKGAYWYTGGINWIAMVCWAIGAALFGLGKSLGIGGALPSLIIAGIIYLIAMNIFKKRPIHTGQPE